MSKRTLVIGCSLSQGSYELKTQMMWGNIPADDCTTSFGWYDMLSSIGNDGIDVYSMPGMGWMSYAHLMRLLDESDQLSMYDIIIIQETFEPRFCILSDGFLESFADSSKIKRDIDVRHKWFPYPSGVTIISSNKQEGMLFYKSLDQDSEQSGLSDRIAKSVMLDVMESPHIATILSACQDQTLQILTKRKLKTLVLSFGKPYLHCDGILATRLASEVYYDECMPMRDSWLAIPSDKLDHYGGHLTVTGNRELGTRINEMIRCM